jgi:hypothetical protein
MKFKSPKREDWTTPDYTFTPGQTYGLNPEDTLEGRVSARGGFGNMSDYRIAKTQNRSEVNIEKKIGDLNKQVEKLESLPGAKPLTRLQKKRLGKGGSAAVNQMKRIRNQAARRARRMS